MSTQEIAAIKRTVVLETPYAAETEEELERNIAYARACYRDCLLRGEAPFGSHLNYTQPGVLDDTVPAERRLGMDAGFVIGDRLDATVVYTDLGISSGMRAGIQRALKARRPVEYRTLEEQWPRQ